MKRGSKGLGTGIARYRNGTTSHLLRDFAAVPERSRKNSVAKMLLCRLREAGFKFSAALQTLELMDYSDLTNRLQHVSFGKVQGSSPKPDSGVSLGDILDQCQIATHEFLEADQGNIKELQDWDSKVSDACDRPHGSGSVHQAAEYFRL